LWLDLNFWAKPGRCLAIAIEPDNRDEAEGQHEQACRFGDLEGDAHIVDGQSIVGDVGEIRVFPAEPKLVAILPAPGRGLTSRCASSLAILLPKSVEAQTKN
jgi:hypothetical protein